MKTCDYCGRETEDSAAACPGCGTSEFHSATTLKGRRQPQGFRFTRQLRFAALGGIALMAAAWLVMSDHSPLERYFLDRVAFRNSVYHVHDIPNSLGMLVSGNIHAPSELACYAFTFLQWFIVCLLLSFMISLFKRSLHESQTA